ncbi:MAG: polysaccharide biosynthesis protein [Nocardioidaceae bacterium]
MSARRTSRQTLRGGVVIAVALGIMNLATYGFTILAARLLGPEEYGALAAVMGLLLVVNVLSLGLQATGARRVSATSENLADIEREVMATSYVTAAALGVLALALAPVVTSILDLGHWGTAALIAVTLVPLSVMGGQAGVLQGSRRWGPLAAIYLAAGIGRLGFGAAALLVERSTEGAMVGVTLGAFLPAVIGWLALRSPARRRDMAPASTSRLPAWAPGGALRETLHNSHALLAFFALSNADVIIARSILGGHQAGLYAGGLILSKAVLFLPQFVVVIAFPSMSKNGAGPRMHLLSLGLVLLIGVVTVAGVAVLSSLAVVFVGGPAYVDLQGRLWVFAALGTLLAMIQLMVYGVVARQRQRMVFVVWGALAVLVCLSPFVGSVGFLLAAVVSVDLVLFVVLLVATLRTPAPRGTSPTASPAAV